MTKYAVIIHYEMDVFISYSRKDRVGRKEGRDVISRIQQAFKENGITYWLDEEGIHSGETFASVISRNISEAKVFLFVSSVNSNASRWTCGEIATASSYDKRIIPFKIDSSPYDPSITIYLAALDTIDYTSNPVRAIRRLIKSVRTYLLEIDAETRQKEEEKIIKQIMAEKAELEEQVDVLDGRIDVLLEEKNLLLSELSAINNQISELRDACL